LCDHNKATVNCAIFLMQITQSIEARFQFCITIRSCRGPWIKTHVFIYNWWCMLFLTLIKCYVLHYIGHFQFLIFFLFKVFLVLATLQQWIAVSWLSLQPLKLIWQVDLKVNRNLFTQSRQSSYQIKKKKDLDCMMFCFSNSTHYNKLVFCCACMRFRYVHRDLCIYLAVHSIMWRTFSGCVTCSVTRNRDFKLFCYQ